MSSSLGLSGDLDDVDLVEDIEAAFGLRFSDDEIERCSTVGHLFELVENKLPDASFGGCATAMTFYRLRRGLQIRVTAELRPMTPISRHWRVCRSESFKKSLLNADCARPQANYRSGAASLLHWS
jgi:hypothetical protein